MPYNLQHLLNLVHDPDPTFDRDAVLAFIERWKDAGGAESRYSQTFFGELFGLMKLDFDILEGAASERHVVFEAPVTIPGESHPKRMDVYRAGRWVIEAKQGSFTHHAAPGHGRRGTKNYQDRMEAAFHQARRYAAYATDGVPPILMVVDVGYRFDIWTAFSGTFGGYGARGSFTLEELADPEVYSLLRDLLDDPSKRNPDLVAAHVTRDVAERLAVLAKNLEESGHDPEKIARFLMRCLFTMFAEDINLLENRLFEKYLRERWLPDPSRFKDELEALWRTMDTGGTIPFVGTIHHFNGALFRDAEALPLSKAQIEKLYEAARADWTNVEPSIFGTLLERALNPKERHALGAHYTPRAYIERLVRPTIEEPLREKWQLIEAEIKRLTATEGDEVPAEKDVKKAIELVLEFKKELGTIRILDPACGSGNFLYVTFDLLKRIEAEIDARLAELGHTQQTLGLADFSVTPAQFFGIEIKPWAKEIAELVIWIGYLQWWRRRHPNSLPSEPILRDHHNIELRDAVLAYDEKVPRLDEHGEPVTVWDGETMKVHPVTGEQVPDEKARKVVYDYVNPRKAEWPEADYVVGNPPFIGNYRMRDALTHGYVETLRKLYPNVPESCDYVMYWWARASDMLVGSILRRFGLITTNSIRQTFAQRVTSAVLSDKSHPASIVFAIPDHPWVDSQDGAAVRIAMTVVSLGEHDGTLGHVVSSLSEEHSGGEHEVVLELVRGVIHPNLKIGVDITAVMPLKAGENLSTRGVGLFGAGFKIDMHDAETLGEKNDDELKKHIRPLRNGRDLIHNPRGVLGIDFYGLSVDEVKSRFPAAYQWLFERVKPERDQNRRKSRRENWWIFGEPCATLRPALQDIRRYIVTPETSKHRVFQFLSADILTENTVVNFALEDAFYLGVFSSSLHVLWALASGGRLGVGNDPRYTKTRCFDPFPFPDATDEQKATIRDLGERLDALRKQQQEKHAKLTITDMYNVLEKLRAGESLSEKERTINEQGLVSSHLLPLHDELDRAVADAYGWPHDLEDEEILQRLVDLNRERAEEEARGLIRWLRPEYQNPEGTGAAVQNAMDTVVDEEEDEAESVVVLHERTWPKDELARHEAIKSLVKEKPGLTTEALQEHFTKGGRVKSRNASIEASLEALAAAGVVVEVDGGRWF
ncbi:class I SAM-dependent DNA methyltransferase [Lujinxingia vulgaris]|uniref:site-specific DNA-methyltransferase (adenine-specific) n=1 Tax=Lujinxingia vulgaris TaxID=2600176 RepID=A0A5C6X1B8_9DELT|nr:DNA methyltransferase [Lujinxingia vulgaris]TXD34033.1 class I SAM-dependent DNA methyltransferase [Lujinxingia vulgaris]